MPRAALFVIAFLTLATPVGAAEFDSKPIDQVVEKALRAFHTPGAAIVVIKDGKVVHLKGYGVRKHGTSDPATPDTVFAIASCTKAFTATLTAMLVEEGKLKWDDRVHDHFPAFRLSDELMDREVTIRDLLSHRTGMPRHDMLWAGRDAGSEDLILRWAQAKPSTSLRSTWEYSNVPFTTAGFIAGKLSDSDWGAAIKKRLFEPLGMTSSSTAATAARTAANHATPHYRAIGGKIHAMPWDEIDHAGGAGCINSTARDMGRWLQFQLGGGRFEGKRLLSEKLFQETHTPQMIVKREGSMTTAFPKKTTKFINYGLGWFISDYRGLMCVSHSGSLTGFRAQVMLLPEKKIGVCVFSNCRPSWMTEAIAKTALDAALGLPDDGWVKFHTSAAALADFQTTMDRKKRESTRKPNTKPSLPLAKYTGTYEEKAYGSAKVSRDEDGLLVSWGRYVFRLEHFHFDTFTAVPIEPKDEVVSFDRNTNEVQFRLGSDGEVESMKFLEQDFARKGKK
ncbi:MAG TPA: serine hydrolase [Urbifossiella sp.]|nr:serine hydrolase [Urbifossiella sp.]